MDRTFRDMIEDLKPHVMRGKQHKHVMVSLAKENQELW